MPQKVHHVKVNIINNSESCIGEPLYLAGNFNNWSSEHLWVGRVPELGEQVSIVLSEIETGDLELKLSRGNWETLTSTKEGKLGFPQITKIVDDTEVSLTIEGWRDLFPKSTASEQVHVLDEYFYFPELDMYRRVWIYLPKDYMTSTRHYPVIYMHDGQHLFDEATSVGRAGPVEWMVDETIDDAPFSAIVIGIDHARDYALRQEEFLINPGHGTESPKGWSYLTDIIQHLKPFVDKQYRTRTEASHTAMVGSSLGGLITIYAGLEFPEIFGTVGAFSPSIWMDEANLYTYSAKKLAKYNVNRPQQEFYFYLGEKERRRGKMGHTNNAKLDLDRYWAWLKKNYDGTLYLDVHPEGKHGAIYWQQAFKKFYDYWQKKLNSSLIK